MIRRALAAERWTHQVTRVLAPNAGPMTLDGTNSFVIRAPGHPAAIVVDPGPDDDGHLDRLQAEGPVELILLTHHHRDHVEGAPRLAARTGAPVRAFDPRLCHGGAPLAEGERIEAAGVRLDVIATPGHTADSVSFHLPDDTAVEDGAPEAPPRDAGGTARGTMITGDTILGRGSTIIAHPGGSLGAYLRSLDRLAEFGAIPVLPAHGPGLPDLAGTCARYATHRASRLDEVRAALEELDREPSEDPALVSSVVDLVYARIDPAVRFAAEASTRAQLEYLAQTD
ncbi:MBL fold metallo-hydrolase [Microbacterium immunditiarum]|uniref:Glyoxylase-like metal-dependent hydrolase (Beta-lactamase superfamily II) n=1 Tax=Microbacterium immunditiarum TaxID=337480 RepID=A0A7Y9GLS0_9MICO|nr:glyoxylase-like metal-dependent hydrolase (beta-lactamase superfamily II) [Microbacterium immunditiarum]